MSKVKVLKSSSAHFGAQGIGGSGPFSVRSAYAVTLTLTALLWWLPVLGQMTAGYVGGRKSGSMIKGTLCAVLASGTFVAIIMGLSATGLSFTQIQDDAMSFVSSSFPAAESFLASAFAYVESFFVTFGQTSLALAVCFITGVFGMIGGIASGQARSEYSARPIATGGGSTARSVEAYRKGREVGFGSFDDHLPVMASQAPREQSATLVRRPAARDEVQEPVVIERKVSPLASVLQMSDRNNPVKEKPVVQSDDMDFI